MIPLLNASSITEHAASSKRGALLPLYIPDSPPHPKPSLETYIAEKTHEEKGTVSFFICKNQLIIFPRGLNANFQWSIYQTVPKDWLNLKLAFDYVIRCFFFLSECNPVVQTVVWFRALKSEKTHSLFLKHQVKQKFCFYYYPQMPDLNSQSNKKLKIK